MVFVCSLRCSCHDLTLCHSTQVDDARIVHRPLGTCPVRAFSTTFKASASDQCACVFEANHASSQVYASVSGVKLALPLPSRPPNDTPEPADTDASTLTWAVPGTEPTITLLVSHMAIGHRDAPHYAEIEGAMRANLRNPALAELFVMYDSTPEDGCAELITRLTTHPSTANKRIAKLSCHDREQGLGQPRVRDLFRFASENSKRGDDGSKHRRRQRRGEKGTFSGATSASRGGRSSGDGNGADLWDGGTFVGNIVVLSNADIAFDSTLAAAPTLYPDLTSSDVLVFSVTGFPDDVTYAEFVGNGNVTDTADIAYKLSRKKAEFKPQVRLDELRTHFVFCAPAKKSSN